MPPLLIFVAAGAGLFLAGRWYRDMQRRVESELRAAEEALELRERESVCPWSRIPRPAFTGRSGGARGGNHAALTRRPLLFPFARIGRARPGHPRLSLCPEIRGCPAQGWA
jgi:hypothetical protein